MSGSAASRPVPRQARAHRRRGLIVEPTAGRAEAASLQERPFADIPRTWRASITRTSYGRTRRVVNLWSTSRQLGAPRRDRRRGGRLDRV